MLTPTSSKFLLPLVSYVFNDGPWRDTQVRLKYDPRTDPDARLYVDAQRHLMLPLTEVAC